MSLLKAATLAATEIYTRPPAAGWHLRLPELLAPQRHVPMPHKRDNEVVAGWTDFGKPDSAALQDLVWGRTIVVSVRLDRKVVPESALRLATKARIEQVMRGRGYTKLSAAHRRELSEAVREELLGRALPATRTVDVAIDLNTGRGLISSARSADIDLVRLLWRESTGETLWVINDVSRLVDAWGELTTARLLNAPIQPEEGPVWFSNSTNVSQKLHRWLGWILSNTAPHPEGVNLGGWGVTAEDIVALKGGDGSAVLRKPIVGRLGLQTASEGMDCVKLGIHAIGTGPDVDMVIDVAAGLKLKVKMPKPAPDPDPETELMLRLATWQQATTCVRDLLAAFPSYYGDDANTGDI